MSPPTNPYQPYAGVHADPQGQGDARPTATQVVQDCGAYDRLRDKTILITGCTSGTGMETARALYETGASLFLTARDMPKLEKLIDEIVSQSKLEGVPRPVPIEMHLDSLESVRKGAEDFKQKSGGKLNILINNAGVMAVPDVKTHDGFEQHFGTNHLSHFLLFTLVKPLLLSTAKASGTTSRVINVSSAGHRRSGIRFDDPNFAVRPDEYDKWLAYGQSKIANVYMANYIARHFGSQGLTGLSVHPGLVATELGRHMGEEDWATLGPQEVFLKPMKSGAQGAATQVWAAVSERFEDVANGGRYLADVGEAGPWPAEGKVPVGAAFYAPHAYDEKAEDRLWVMSADMVGVEA